MDKTTVAALIPHLVSPNDTVRHAALRTLYAGDENAAVILCDLFAAGLNEVQACAVLEVLGEMGGFDALMLLFSAFHFDPRPGVKESAAFALERNSANLNAEERAEIAAFLRGLP
jgi:hypothetical protein